MIEYVDWNDMDSLRDGVMDEAVIDKVRDLTKGNPCIWFGFHRESGSSGDRALALWLEKNEPEHVVTEWYTDGFGRGCNVFYYDEAFADEDYDLELWGDEIINDLMFYVMEDGAVDAMDDLLIKEAWEDFCDFYGHPLDDGAVFEKFKKFMLDGAIEGDVRIGAFDIEYCDSELLRYLGYDKKETETWGVTENKD